ncbi:TonB-dependent receptor [Candidatus Poribacteria bacterium]|nr:TonB-dependent receptor [Candidatus Poribacteria bacterium]
MGSIDAENNQVKDFQLQGEVIDIQSRTRVAYVKIQIIGKDQTVYTDSEGQFQFLGLTKGEYTLQFTKEKYDTLEQNVKVNTSTPYLQIELKSQILLLKTINVYDSIIPYYQYKKTSDILLNETDIDKKIGMTIGQTLSKEAGISQRTMGRAVSRPVIRGLGGDRLLILENGERTGDKSASSADHAVAIDPTSAEGIEITRGPASLLYGSSTLGGVINIRNNSIPNFIPVHTTMKMMVQGESVNSGLTTTTRLMQPLGNLVASIDWNRRSASDTHTPLGILKNTQLSNLNYTTGISVVRPWGYIGTSAGQYNSEYGVPGSPEGHIDGVDVSINRHRYDTHMELNLNHDWMKSLKIQSSYTQYIHQEIESNGSLGVEFGVLTYNFTATAYLFENMVAGLWGEFRDHATGGFYWTPHTREYALAGFYMNQTEIDRFTLQGSLRYDIRRAEPFNPGIVIRAGTVKRTDFGGLSMGVSGIYDLLNNLDIGVTIMKTFRAPGIEELFSDGPHLAVYSYEIGNAELESENGSGGEIFTEFSNSYIKLKLALYQNYINGYLIPTNTGLKEWGSGSAGWLWIYQYSGTDVQMNGFEIQFDANLLPQLNIHADTSYVIGEYEESGLPLDRIPPLNGKVAINYNLSPFNIHITTRFSASQNRLGEFETPTDSYIVHDAGFYVILPFWQLENLLVFEIENLLNTTYYDHLSRIKSIIPESGRNVKLLYKLNY